jgi:hypothetical protein
VFEIVPDPLAVAVTVKVAVPPRKQVTDAARSPLPLAGQTEPALAAQVHVAPAQRSPGSCRSPSRRDREGPAFDATIVYVTVPPWFTPVTPSVLVIERSAVGAMTVLPSVALLFPAGSFTPTGAATVAVLEIVPEPLDRRRDVKVAVPPRAGRRSR